MKIKVKRSDLVEGLQKVGNIVNDGGVIPVLSNVVLKAENDKLILMSNNLEQRIITTVEAEIEDDGAITLPAKRLIALVGKYDKDEVTFSNDGNIVNIYCGRSRQTWNSIPVDEFPRHDSFDAIISYSLKSSQIFDGLQKTVFAASKDTIQKGMQGVCFLVNNGEFKSAATDGKRLAFVTENVDNDGESKIVLPFKTALELKRMINNGEDEVKIDVGEKQCDVTIGNTVINSKLLEEEFADFEKSFPKDSKVEIKINSKKLLSALERVVIALENANQSVYLNITEDKMLFAASSTTVGRNDETIDIDYKGEEINMSFNPIYLIELLKAVDSEEISLHYNEAGKAVVIKDGKNLQYIFMPLRDRN